LGTRPRTLRPEKFLEPARRISVGSSHRPSGDADDARTHRLGDIAEGARHVERGGQVLIIDPRLTVCWLVRSERPILGHSILSDRITPLEFAR